MSSATHRTVIALLLLAGGCGGGGGGSPTGTPDGGANPDPTGDLVVPEQGFQILSPTIDMPPGTERTYCYYFTLHGPAATGVKRWESQMTPGSHHLIVYLTGSQEAADGTLTPDCAGFGSSIVNVPVWAYAAQVPYNDGPLPEGIGMNVVAEQHGFVQMHYLNATDQPLSVHVTVNGYTFKPTETYTSAAAFVTYNTDIKIPSGVGMSASAEGTCRIPDGATFFALSTHAHRRSVRAWVKDGDSMLVDSDNWEHPITAKWQAPQFFRFTSGLTYHCDYVNDLNQEVRDGPSAQTNEMCMAIGYFFPATKPVFCINSLTINL